MVVDEPQKLYLSLSVVESVQRKLFLMYLCSVCSMNFSSQNIQNSTSLTLILLMWRIWRSSNNDSRWQMGFNSAFKGLIIHLCEMSTIGDYPNAAKKKGLFQQ